MILKNYFKFDHSPIKINFFQPNDPFTNLTPYKQINQHNRRIKL